MILTPQTTYVALLIVQTAHLLHHRLAKRHISFAEASHSPFGRRDRDGNSERAPLRLGHA